MCRAFFFVTSTMWINWINILVPWVSFCGLWSDGNRTCGRNVSVWDVQCHSCVSSVVILKHNTVLDLAASGISQVLCSVVSPSFSVIPLHRRYGSIEERDRHITMRLSGQFHVSGFPTPFLCSASLMVVLFIRYSVLLCCKDSFSYG
jgi:hypothetical protein